MTPEQITLVQTSWQQVLPARTQVAALFYRRLFELDASLEALFRRDLEAQGAKLMAALDFVVQGLGNLGERLGAVQALARRHTSYGAQPQHFDTVGEALLWTLREGLGEAATTEVLGAWSLAYTLVADTMKDAAWPATRSAPEWAAQAG